MTCENHKKTFWSLFLNTLEQTVSVYCRVLFITHDLLQYKLGSTWDLVCHRESPSLFSFQREATFHSPVLVEAIEKGRWEVSGKHSSVGTSVLQGGLWKSEETERQGWQPAWGLTKTGCVVCWGACTVAGDFCSALLWKTHAIGLHEVRWKCWSSVQI